MLSSFPAIDPAHAAAAVLALVLLHAARRIALRYRSSRTRSRHMSSITVKWGREKLRVPLPPTDTKLAILRNALAEVTALPPSSFKLVHAGAVMKDDNVPISSYGIHAGSTIALIGGGIELPRAAAPTGIHASRKTPATEESTITAIQEELAHVNSSIVPALNVFLTNIAPEPSSESTLDLPSAASLPSSHASSTPVSRHQATPSNVSTSTKTNGTAKATAPPLPDIEMEHTRLGELLLQSLLRLDVLVLDGAWTDARRERKGAVRQVQTHLDRLDGGWKNRSDRLKPES